MPEDRYWKKCHAKRTCNDADKKTRMLYESPSIGNDRKARTRKSLSIEVVADEGCYEQVNVGGRENQSTAATLSDAGVVFAVTSFGCIADCTRSIRKA